MSLEDEGARIEENVAQVLDVGAESAGNDRLDNLLIPVCLNPWLDSYDESIVGAGGIEVWDNQGQLIIREPLLVHLPLKGCRIQRMRMEIVPLGLKLPQGSINPVRTTSPGLVRGDKGHEAWNARVRRRSRQDLCGDAEMQVVLVGAKVGNVKGCLLDLGECEVGDAGEGGAGVVVADDVGGVYGADLDEVELELRRPRFPVLWIIIFFMLDKVGTALIVVCQWGGSVVLLDVAMVFSVPHVSGQVIRQPRGEFLGLSVKRAHVVRFCAVARHGPVVKREDVMDGPVEGVVVSKDKGDATLVAVEVEGDGAGIVFGGLGLFDRFWIPGDGIGGSCAASEGESRV